MPGDVNLYQLADLALKEPEVGVVNFNCLHRLLVELIKRTASNRKPYISSLEKEGDFDEKKELVSQEVNEPYAKGDEQQNVDLQETGSLTSKIDGLLGSNKDLLSKVSNLEEEVHNMRQIPSNSKILDYLSSVASTNDDARSSPVANETESNEELGISSPKKVSKEKVSNNFMPLIWRSMKHEKKISSLEDGIEKLFSLFQDLTMELKDMKQDLASSKQDFGNKKEILTNQIEKLSSMLIDLKSQIEALSGAQQDASGILSNLKEKVSTIGSALQNIPVSSDAGKEDNFVGDKEFSGLNSSVQGLQSELDALHQKMDDLDQLRNHLEHSRAGQAAMDNQIRDLKSELKHYVKHKDIKNLVSWAALEKAFNIDGMKETIHGLQRKMETLSNMAFQKSQHSPMLSRLRSGSEYGDFLSMPIAPLSDNEEDELVTRRVISLGDQLLSNDLADAGNRETWQNAMVEDQQGSVMGKEFEYSPRKKSSFDDDKKSMSRDGMDSSRQGMESVGRIHDDMNSNEQIVLQEMAKMDSKEIISSNKSPVGVGFDTSGAENDKTPVKVFGGMNAPIEGFDETANFPSPQLQDMFRRIIELALKQGELEERVHIISSRRQLEVPANVTDARVDIKYLESLARLAEENRLLIENLASEVRVLAKVRAEFSSSSDPPLAVDPDSHAFHNHLHELDDKIQQLSAVFGSYRISSDNLFKQNQQQADAIYTFLDELNKNKADKDDTASKQLLSAYQKAVDSKVSMNTFDQSMRLLDQGLQEALQEIESYRREETALREALDKLAMDVGGKLDSKAGESLKQYLEKKIGEIKKSRNDLAQNSDVRNAAGARKPCLVPFHCISCNRPVEFTYKGILPPIPYPLPSKKSKAPLTAFEIDQIRRNKVTSTAKETFTQASLALTDRPCGGQHTTFALTRIAKTSWWTAEEVDADPVIQREPSIIDALTGKDGHIYRGRYRPSDLHDPVSSDLEADVRITHSHDKISTKQTKNSKPNKRTKAESPVHFPSITQCPSPPPRPRISNQRTTRRLETSARSVTSEGDLRKSV